MLDNTKKQPPLFQWLAAVTKQGALVSLNTAETKILFSLFSLADNYTMEIEYGIAKILHGAGYRLSSMSKKGYKALNRLQELGFIKTVDESKGGRYRCTIRAMSFDWLDKTEKLGTTESLEKQREKLGTKRHETRDQMKPKLGTKRHETRDHVAPLYSVDISLKKNISVKARSGAGGVAASLLDVFDKRWNSVRSFIQTNLQEFGVYSAPSIFKKNPDTAARLLVRLLLRSAAGKISVELARHLSSSERLEELDSDEEVLSKLDDYCVGDPDDVDFDNFVDLVTYLKSKIGTRVKRPLINGNGKHLSERDEKILSLVKYTGLSKEVAEIEVDKLLGSRREL